MTDFAKDAAELTRLAEWQITEGEKALLLRAAEIVGRVARVTPLRTRWLAMNETTPACDREEAWRDYVNARADFWALELFDKPATGRGEGE